MSATRHSHTPRAHLTAPLALSDAGPIYETVLKHVGSERPWAIDAHLYYDEEAGRLWMSWGGHVGWVCELDPASGKILDPNTNAPVASPDFSSHATSPLPVHTRILGWAGGMIPAGYPPDAFAPPDWWDDEGDRWSTAYMEGPAIWKQATAEGTFWYACGTYGALDANYNIRCCRAPYASSARGPYYDRAGIACTSWDPQVERYGATMLLAADGDQLVPGHPHFWSEASGATFVGFDVRKGSSTVCSSPIASHTSSPDLPLPSAKTAPPKT